MKHCEQCNQNFADDFSYCLSCGNPIKEVSVRANTSRESFDQETFVRCPQCRNYVRSDARLCEHCGTGLRNVESSVTLRPEPPPTQYVQPSQLHALSSSSQTSAEHSGFSGGVAPTRVAMPTAPIRNDPTAPSLSSFQPYGTAPARRQSSFRWWHGMLLLVFFFGVIGVAAVGVWWWLSNRDSATDDNRKTVASETNSSGPSTSQAKAEPTVAQNSADIDLRRLQERIRNAQPSDSEILTSISAAEQRYPDDYRFTYERAKLIGKGMISHGEAWRALRRAAEMAIDNNDAEEMLSDIKSRAQTDFRKLSSHYDEWNAIINGLESLDKSALPHVH